MKLGLLTAAFPELTLEQIAAWASAEGFQALEVACWPSSTGRDRRYGGVAHLDVTDFDPGAVQELLAKHELEISALAYYPNNLHPEVEHRMTVHTHLRAVIDAAKELGVTTVGTFVGNDRWLPIRANLERFRELWPPLVDYAAERGVDIAIENCPMLFSLDEWPGGENLAWSPAIWEELFAAIPDRHFGLNLDPSHLIWLMIDYERAVYEFGERILHVHAKDLEIRGEALHRHGTLSLGMGWQVPRLPGLGEIDWSRFTSALYAVGYDGIISVEHEDRAFEGSLELTERGFRLARDHLSPLIQ